MSFYQVSSMAHSGAAILLLALGVISVLISVLIAVKPAADSANEALVRRANRIGLIQNAVRGIVALSGVMATFLGSWSFSQFWLWSGLVVVAFYGLAIEFITKPARMAVAEGGSEGKVGLQVGLQVAHVLLLLVTFASMVVKPEL